MVPKQMKAAYYEQYGEPDVLKYGELPTPVPGRGEALVKVNMVGLNGYDLMARSGRYKPNKDKFPHVLGGDFGGELVALGPETTSELAIGARVTSWWVVPCGTCEQCMGGFPNRCSRNYRYLGAHLPGAYAQYVKLPAHHLIALPDAVSDEQAASFANAFGTAWHMVVVRGQVRPGETVLVNSASSGVSMAAIQICKNLGAYVYASSSAQWKLDKALELGADEVLNYNEVDFPEEIMKRTRKRGVDVVIEHVGGDFLGKSIRCLTRGGRVVTVGGTRSYKCEIDVNYVFHKELAVVGSNSATKLDLDAMMPMLAQGKLKSIVDRVFPLSEAAEAHRYLESAKQFGKVLLRVEH